MASLELMSKRGEKNLLLNMFRDSDDSIASSMSEQSDTDDTIPVDEGILGHSDSMSHQQCISQTGSITHDSQLHDFQIILHQDKVKGIAHQLWPAASFFCNYFESNLEFIINLTRSKISGDCSVQSLNVIELGAGIGLCGLFIARLFSTMISNDEKTPQIAKVILTDLPEALETLTHNTIENNLSEYVEVMPLSWGSSEDFQLVMQQLDHSLPLLIVAADCVYWECLYEPFLETLLAFTSVKQQGHINILIAHVRRWKKDTKFFALCKKRGLHVDIVQETMDVETNEHTKECSRRVTRMYHIYA